MVVAVGGVVVVGVIVRGVTVARMVMVRMVMAGVIVDGMPMAAVRGVVVPRIVVAGMRVIMLMRVRLARTTCIGSFRRGGERELSLPGRIAARPLDRLARRGGGAGIGRRTGMVVVVPAASRAGAMRMRLMASMVAGRHRLRLARLDADRVLAPIAFAHHLLRCLIA